MLNYFPLMWDYTTTKNVYYKKKKKNRCNNIEIIAIVYEKCCNKI